MTQQELQQPFFARFLELQKRQQQNSNEGLYDPWPVPVPTKPLVDIEHTLKYPSDGDEI